MAVQQGQLGATDTTIDMSNYYNDAVASTVSDVDRAMHNGTQYVRLVLQRPQPTSATRFTASGSTTIDTSEYIDGSFVALSATGVIKMTVGFDTLVTTSSIRIFSTTAIDNTKAKWTVSTSLNNLESEFTDSDFEATISTVSQAIVSTVDGGYQYRYTLALSAGPPIDSTNAGLRYWRITHDDNDAFNGVTEIQIIEPLTPTISYFDTNGSLASSFTFDQTNILDAAYDNINNVFYTIRFNSGSVGTSTITLSDNFGDDDAGTASGTTNFNPSRWNESSTNTAFLRTGGSLSYNVATGQGQLETTYTLEDFTVAIDVNPQTVNSEQMWFTLRALDSDNKTLVQEGVGIETSPTNSGVYFASAIENFTDSAANSNLRDARPLWHNCVSGTDTFTIAFNGSEWTVSGSQTGALTNAQTGVLYDEAVDSSTPLEFLISSTATPSPGEQFTFDLVTDNVKKEPTATGILVISRTGSNVETGNVFTTPRANAASAANIELYGHTNATINISADNFAVTGSGTFSDVGVFTIEKTDSEGSLTVSPTVIESFDVIGDPTKTYNSFLNGVVQIAATSSGTGGGFIYVKVEDTLYKYPNSASLTSEDGSNATISTQGQIASGGTHSFSWTHESGVGMQTPFLTYIEYDADLDIVHLRTINKDTLIDTTDTKEVLLSMNGYSATQEFRVFYNQNDFDTLYFVDASGNLQSFNIDDRISAFMAVNAEDTTLPAGTAQQTAVNADVVNAWGEALSGKTVTFSVTVGDGAVSPATDSTDAQGRATTQFTVGSTVGVSTVTATVTEA